MARNKVNIYICHRNHKTITIDVDYGVTLYMIECKHPGCNAKAFSQCYQVDQNLKPTHGWFRRKETDNFTNEERLHHENGGVFLYPLNN